MSVFLASIPSWRIEDALEYLRALQPIAAEMGYNLSLGGGVLNKGYSIHDLDIVVAPAKERTMELDKCLEWIESLLECNEIVQNRIWNPMRMMDGRKVDWFIVK